jgi:hypothetical protein
MPEYTVNGTITVFAWITVEADSPEAAVEIAAGTPAYHWDTDAASGEVQLNVTPRVELITGGAA